MWVASYYIKVAHKSRNYTVLRRYKDPSFKYSWEMPFRSEDLDSHCEVNLIPTDYIVLRRVYLILMMTAYTLYSINPHLFGTILAPS